MSKATYFVTRTETDGDIDSETSTHTMSNGRLNPPSRPIAALDRVTGSLSTSSQHPTASRSHQTRMHELDAKIIDVKSQITSLNDELKILSKEKELEKQKELLRERTLLVESQREEVERLKEAHRLFEAARRQRE